MSNQKKFGAFAGVFTPSLLTILGVIMYMRLGWVVGNAGLIGTILIIVIAHLISISTGLSISSIATDKKVGAGGVYYVLSRSLGLPIGGAIGVTLFAGTALSIALYLIGFAESFNPYFGLESGINGLRLGGSMALLIMTIIALISTSFALKTQFFIMAAIAISLVSIFFGVSPQEPLSLSYLPGPDGVSMETIFAIFFPAVTGFTAGIAMSGDLSDPKKSIPRGTLWAIGVGFVVYVSLATFIFYSVDGELLRTDNNILLKLALFAPAVVAGIWGATLSSALGGILGGPRILQAMSVDKITPRLFAKGVGKGNDPRNALFLTVLIAETGILIGELDTIARICSMFYLAAYGFINLSFFLESWASSDFNPTFKVKKWVGLLGFIATFVVMFRLDMLAMIAAFVVIGGIYFWLAKKQLALGSGDVWQSVWSSVVKTGLRRMDDKQDHQRNWKPNVLLFSGGTTHRPHLLEFSKELVGHRGIVTNFDLYENQEATLLFPKHKQSVNDEVLKQYGVFGRRLEVKNIFKGIESIASTFGFSGIEPNTILMGWAKNTTDPVWFAQMTQKLMDLDYNVMYLDYDDRFGFRQYAQIDLWWTGVDQNAELMLNISKFLVASDLWRNAQIRILLVDETNSNKKIIEKKIHHLLEDQRVVASVKVISNATDQRELYELMKIYSSDTDLVLVGIPEIDMTEVDSFVRHTNDLVGTIGTTLLVKASTRFNEVELFSSVEPQIQNTDNSNSGIPDQLDIVDSGLQDLVHKMDRELTEVITTFYQQAFAPVQEKYLELFYTIIKQWETMSMDCDNPAEGTLVFRRQLRIVHDQVAGFRLREINVLSELIKEAELNYSEQIQNVLLDLPKRIRYTHLGQTSTIPFRDLARVQYLRSFVPANHLAIREFGFATFRHLFTSNSELISRCQHLFEWGGLSDAKSDWSGDLQRTHQDIHKLLRERAVGFETMIKESFTQLLTAVRRWTNEIIEICESDNPVLTYRQAAKHLDRKRWKSELAEQEQFSGLWKENQQFVHKTIEVNLSLAEVNLQISQGVRTLMSRLDQDINQSILRQLDKHVNTVIKVSEEFQEQSTLHSLDQIQQDESRFQDVDRLLEELNPFITGLTSTVEGEAILMNKSLFEDYKQNQLSGFKPVTLDLPKIVDFILETKFVGEMRVKLDGYLQDISSVHDQQTNKIVLLQSTLAELKLQKVSKKEIKQLLETVKGRILHDQEKVRSIVIRFEEQIRSIVHDLQIELDSQHLVEHSDNWERFISVSRRKRGLELLISRFRTSIREQYMSFIRLLTGHKHQSEVSLFLGQHDLKSDLELGLSFVRDLAPDLQVESQLPFYYKQLFQGKHLPVQQRYIGRDRELEAVSIWQQEKVKGALLIAGNSGSGKTHFSRYVAGQVKSKKGVILELSGRFGHINEWKRLVSTASQFKGSVQDCLDQLPGRSVIIINDLEVWWNRTSKEDVVLEIIHLVKEYNKRHTFIINGNLFSMEALTQHRPIGGVVTSTVILGPLTKEAMFQIIMERHFIGGLDLEYRGEVNPYSKMPFRRFVNRLSIESEGHIGRCLQLWLRSIVGIQDHQLVMAMKDPVEGLRIKSADWKWVLYQFIIGHHLMFDQMSRLFEGQEGVIRDILEEMESCQLIHRVGSAGYILNPNVKPVVEHWLFKQGLFN